MSKPRRDAKSARRAGDSLIISKSRRTQFCGWETLESRLLMSTDYLLNGNQLTQIINGTAQSPTTVNNINNVQITAVGSDNVTVENFAGAVTITGGGGGDTFTVYGGGGGSVHVTDPSASPADQLIVRAPTTSADNFSASSGSVSLASGDAISWGSGVGSVSMVGQLFSNGDSLSIAGAGGQTIAVGASSVTLGGSAPTLYYSTFNGITVNGGASDNFSLAGDSIPTTLNAGSGNDSFTVTTNSVALSLNGGSGNDTYTINSNSGLLTATGGSGNSTFIVNASSSSMTLNGGSGTNAFTVQSNSATLNLNGGGTTNTTVVNGNSSTLIARGGTGSTDSYTVNATTGGVTLAGGTGSSAYTISAPTVAAVTVTGSTTGTGTLTFDGTTLNNAFSVTTNSVSAGSGAAVGFTHLTGLVVNGIGGNDSFLLGSDSTPTTLIGSTGNDTFNIQATSSTLAIHTGSGTSTVNLGSNAPQSASNTVAGLTGAITVTGDGSDTLNFNDAADTTARTATLTGTSLTGLGTGGMTYSGLAAINLKLGSGGNALAIHSTAASTVTNFNTGAGANTIYLGSTNANALGGVMDNVLGTLNLTGSGSDSLVIDDSGNTNSKTVTLSAAHITGISTGQINYTGISAMSLDLGTAGNNVTVSSTLSTTGTTITGGAGNDTFTVAADSGALQVNTGGGTDVINVQTIAATTTVNSSGHSHINLGTTAPATGGVLSGLAAGLTVTGAGTDTLTADDSGDTLASTGTLSASALHGLGMASAGVNYSGLAALSLNLGSSTNALTITNTAANTPTHITGGAAADTITLQNDASPTTITSGAGNDQITVQAASAATSIIAGDGNDQITVHAASAATSVVTGGGNDQINVQGITAAMSITTGAGTDTVNVGSNAPATPSATASVAATLTLTGGGNTQLNVDDTGDNTARTATLTSTTLTGISGGSGIAYSGLSGLAVSLGSGGNTVQVTSTAATTPTTINSGSGNDTISVLATAGITTINTGTGTNTVNVGSTSLPNGTLTSINGTLNLNGNSTGGNDSVALIDASDTSPRIITLNPASVTGASPATINFNHFGLTSLYTGSANNQITLTNTHTGVTVISAGNSSNTITLEQISGSTTLQAGNSTIALQNAASATTISSTAPNQITIGNPVTGGRTTAGITAAVQLTGVSGSSVSVDDSADPVARTANISQGSITGLSTGMIDYSGLAHLGVLLGTGGNTLAINDTASDTPTTITGGAGNDVLNIQADSAPLTLAPAAGSNTINLGNSGSLAGIASPITVTSTGNDTLNLNDSSDTTARTAAALSPTSVNGLGAASIGYSGVTQLNVSLGNADDTLNVIGTAAGTPTTVNTGTAGSAVNVQATTGTLSIQSGAADAVNIGSNGASAGLLNTITGAVTVTGNDTVNINDNADTSNSSAVLTATTLTGLGATAAINYTGLSHLNINLGTGNDGVTVNGTAAGSTVINSGGGNNAITINATTAPLVINSGGTVQLGTGDITGITGAVTLAGTGSDQLLLDDINDQTNVTGTVSATQMTLGLASVSYAGTGAVAVQLGGGTDTFTINSTAPTTPVTLTGGTGTDTLQIAGISSPTTVSAGTGSATTLDVGNALSELASPLTLAGNGGTTLNINDTASTISKTGTLGSTSLTGLGTDGINYTGIGQLNLSLGSGGNTFTVSGATTPTAITAGSDHDALFITTFTAPVTVNGNQTASLVLDDSTDNSANSVAIFGSTVTGLGTSGVIYGSLASLNVLLGSGDDAVTINGTGGATTTTVTGNAAGQTFTVVPAGGVLQGPLTLAGAGTDPLVINDVADFAAASVTLGNAQVAGFGGTISYTGMATLAVNLAGGNDTATITALDPTVITSIDGGGGANIANINLPGDLSGNLKLTHFQNGSVDVAGNFSGSLSTDGSFSTVHVHGNFSTTGLLGVSGVLDQIEVDGTDEGQLTVGSLQGVVEPSVIPSSDGTIFSLSSGGVTRSIQIQNADPSASLTGTRFSVVYDATTGVPQAAVRVNGGTSGERFDVVLNAPITSSFSLSRLDSSDGLTTDVRNVVVNGSVLGTLTPAESAYFNGVTAAAGGVMLPADALASVSARDTLSAGSILAQSIQGMAFSYLTGGNGTLHPGGFIPVSDFKEKLLLSALAVNPRTHKAYATVLAPTETLIVPAGTVAEKTGLFAGSARGLPFDPNGIVLWNRDGSGEVTAAITFSGKRINGEETISTLAFDGAGGSVQTKRIISAISSSDAIGDIYLLAGKTEQLQSITAPSIEGTIKLYGGKLVGTIQTTAVEGGDIGSSDGSSTIALGMGPKAQIISRGNLFSDVQVSGNLTGTIAASGDIDGSVTVTGGVQSTGHIIAFDAIVGPVSVAGGFSGEMAAGGSTGITGNVVIRRGIGRGAVVASAGEIGDATAGTSLTTSSVAGTVAAVGPERLSVPRPRSPVVEGGDTATLIGAIWNPLGQPIEMDDSPGDLAGLTDVETGLKALSITDARSKR